MDLFKIRRLYDTVIYLIACTLNRQAPKRELIDESELREIYSFAKRHMVSALVTTALESIGLASPEAITEKNLAIRKIMLLDAERTQIFSEFERQGIRYMPLKGIIIKELYPSIGMRQMSDNDILFDGFHRKKVRDIMLSRGYKDEEYNSGNHDVYMKEPVYNFEMHVSLFSAYPYETFYSYFKNALDVAKKDEGNYYGYSMSDDYYYIYIKTHEYKHQLLGGTGIRSLVDSYVFIKSKENSINLDYIKAEIEKLGFSDYEEKTRELSLKVFEPEFCERNLSNYNLSENGFVDMLSEEERLMLDGFFFSGTYGTTKKNVENDIERIETETGNLKSAKRKYIFKKIFPPMEYYKSFYPFFYKHKYLIPALIVYRVGAMIFKRPKSTLHKLKSVARYKGGKNNKDSQ